MYILFIGVILHVYVTVVNLMSCDEDWLEYQGKCLKHYSSKIPWTGAKGTCVQLRKAQLAIVDSPEINMFVHDNLIRGSDVWIGLSVPDISKPSWQWSDGGNTSSYDDWNIADVISVCAVMKYRKMEGYWYTRPCTYGNYYICEKEMFADSCADWLYFDTHCYLIIHAPKETNMAAARNCWQYDAYLISINSQQEADFIYSKLEIHQEYWIGLSPLIWVSGVPYQWNNWGDSGPTHNITYGCVYMEASSGKWFYGHCILEYISGHSYICQRDAVIALPTTPNVALEVDTSTNSVLGESYTAEFDALNISDIQGSSDDSKPLLLTAVVPSVCGGIVVIIVIIVVVIVIRRKKRKPESQDAKSNEAAIYYNDIQKTRDNEMVKATDTNQRKINGTNRHVLSKDTQALSAYDTERNTYEQLSQDPYVNSGQITAGTYASLQ